MPRRYQQRVRAAGAAATRRRIVAAGREVLGEQGGRLLLGEVARRAGVARSTVYATVGGTGGLVRAVADDMLAVGGFEALLRAADLPDPHAAVREVLSTGLGLWAAGRPAIRGMYALARVDPEVAAVIAELDRNQRAILDALGARFGSAHAGALLAVLASFDTYDLLAGTLGLADPDITQLLVTAADRTLR